MLTGISQAQSSDSNSYYSKKFAKDSAEASYKNNNAFSKDYSNKYSKKKSSTTSTCADRSKRCDYEK